VGSRKATWKGTIPTACREQHPFRAWFSRLTVHRALLPLDVAFPLQLQPPHGNLSTVFQMLTAWESSQPSARHSGGEKYKSEGELALRRGGLTSTCTLERGMLIPTHRKH